MLCVEVFVRLAEGLTDFVHANQPINIAMINVAVEAINPAATGKIEAKITPIKPKPSRQATSRLRCASEPPSIAPQDWCAMLNAL